MAFLSMYVSIKYFDSMVSLTPKCFRANNTENFVELKANTITDMVI